ncbi:hypothetical protein [Chitinimonas lacunae]|uniref:Uncharacterized protein n=1 Tax=Chitinimonas lacunae TaxID=1963018 RepID=A0ABV8MQT4_9NEIS
MGQIANEAFLNQFDQFVTTRLMTAAGIEPSASGLALFDLYAQEIDVPGGNAAIAQLALHSQRSSRLTLVQRAFDAAKPVNPIPAYWVPQGGYCDVPIQNPESHFVFTPDFSGCAIYVDEINSNTYRVYHVEGGKYHQYPNHRGLQPSQLVGLMRHGREYAQAATNGEVSVRAFAFLKFVAGSWHIFCQNQNGVSLGLRGSKFVPIGEQTVKNPAYSAPIRRLSEGAIAVPATMSV